MPTGSLNVMIVMFKYIETDSQGTFLFVRQKTYSNYSDFLNSVTHQNKMQPAGSVRNLNYINNFNCFFFFIKRPITAATSVRPETSDLYLYFPPLSSLPAPHPPPLLSSSHSSLLQWHKSDPANSVRRSHARSSHPLSTRQKTQSLELCRFRDSVRTLRTDQDER